MRVWLDPQKMANLDMAPAEIVDAIKSQNTQAAFGQAFNSCMTAKRYTVQ